ncbi:MAG: dTDP-4-dehydrorhamnose reductase [Candidatus Gracilibacteria bacterium]|nr:dTDP-4-dehydrorhamnose reductase [Candidatus Peregrinibacteria bacterium]
MRILILGKNGMLGRDMQKVFADMDFVALGQSDLDITDQEKVFETFMSIQPDVVVNCSGYTNVDDAEKDFEMAEEINGYAVGVLARACREIDATFVHFSTDYVFRGDKKSGYSEEDGTNPVNAYGRSKMLGEQLIFDEMESISQENPKEGKYFIIRTSWLFGKHGKNFVDTMLEMGKIKDTIQVVDDQHGKPTYTIDLCEQVKWLITSHEYPSGVYHITNEGPTTWFAFAKKIFQLSNMKTRVVPCSSDDFRRPARRPKYSILKNNALPKLRSWEEALEDYLKTT